MTGYLGQGSQTAPAQAAERQEERAAEYGTPLPKPAATPPCVRSRTAQDRRRTVRPDLDSKWPA